MFFILSLVTCHLSLVTSVSADEISSKASVVMDAATGRVLFAKNPNLSLPPASTTKLVTAMVVLDRAKMNDTVTINERAAKVPSLKGTRFREGESATVETLLYASLIRSANDAAFALAEHVAGSEERFVGFMNKKVIAIGAHNTKFINTTGLPGRGQRITAYDLAKIMRYALKYPEIREIIATKETEIFTKEGRTISLENTNKLLWSDDGAVGGKTGYTRAARHCFVYAGEKNGDTVIVAVLGASSRRVLWEEAEKLEEKGFGVIANNEQPVVYFAKADYKEKSKIKIQSSRHRRVAEATKLKKNNKIRLAKFSSKKKSKITRVVNNRSKEIKKTRNTKIARSRVDGNKG
ncbi:MAG: D-alanyl-D-alanine carboxypeptidase [Nitrospirae bacterium]|nr:D-alanyl-D-alanine carboxypeptidase [Nitrospirota bacterium]